MTNQSSLSRHKTNISNPDMEVLLKKSGFAVRGNRADCAFCKGTAKATVSWNSEVAHCHRCHWSGNARTLSRKLGFAVSPETAAHREARVKAEEFSTWINSKHRIISDRYRVLGRKAQLAKEVLKQFSDCDPAWTALATFYNEESRLTASLETLSFEKTPEWLESQATPVGLFKEWETQNAVR